MNAAADRHLLFGLLALQNGIINQGQLVAAFQAWTLDKSRSLADHLEARGELNAGSRALLEGLVAFHLEAHGGDVEKSLAAVSAGKSTRESLARIGDPEIEATLGRVPLAHGSTENGDADVTGSYAVGSATSDGQRFRVLRPYARGGLGAVFVALDSELNREVALKQIIDDHADDPDSRQRFLLEAEVTGGLEHPGIVPVYGLGTYADGRPYYAMRFIKGDSLKEAIEQFHGDAALKADPGRRSLELRTLLHRFTDVCNAIDYAHSRGVLHRDIKPGNIIVGKYGETLVVDWGLAKPLGRVEPGQESGERTLVPSSASGSSETLPGSAMGTPAYMSPEQARGELDRLGPWSDVYSLGATLYCLLTGRPPFESDDIGELLRDVQRGDFGAPRSVDSAIDPALEAVCLKAMALEPDDRFATCRALADDVERWMADEPVTAWCEPVLRRARRWARQNRTAVTSLAASVLVALVGTATVLAVQTRANSVLTAKNNELDKANRLKAEANVDLRAANERVTKANSDLESANQREKQRFDLAMEAIKLFHGEVGDDLVLKADQFKPLRDRLLNGAADFYGKLEGLLKNQPDRASRAAMGNAYFELGELTAKIGNKTGALAAHQNGLAVRRAMASEPAGNAETQTEVAKSLEATAWLLNDTGLSGAALDHLQEACKALDGLPVADPGYAERQAVLGRIHGKIGSVLASTGKMAAAMTACQQSVEILTRLTNDHPNVTDFESRLADSQNAIGVLQSQTGKPGEAMEWLRRTLAIRQKLADANPAVAEFRNRLAGTYYELGSLMSKTGKRDEAMVSYRRALAINQRLADENPAVTKFRRGIAQNHQNLGNLMARTGKSGEALVSYRLALAIYQKLVDDDPAVTDYQNSLATTYNNIGIMSRNDGKPADAIESYGRALAIWDKLAADNPTIIDFQKRLANSHNNIGRLLAETGRPVEALASFHRALAIAQKLTTDNPTVAEFRTYLMDSHNCIGMLQAGTGKPAEAMESFRQALAIQQKLADDNLSSLGNRDDLATSHAHVADTHRRLGQFEEASESFSRAIAISEELVKREPDATDFRRSLAISVRGLGLVRLATGDTAGAVAVTRRAAILIEGLPSRTGADWAELACCHATLAGTAGRTNSGISRAEGEAAAAKAMDLLRRAVSGGYGDVAEMATDTALDSLRDRPDFRLMMMDLAFPGQPLAR